MTIDGKPLDPAPTGGPKKPFHVPSLDGMRAIAFAIVFMSHVGFEQIFPGGFGVVIFFFMSGYLLTTLLRLDIAKGREVSVPRSYGRRFVRIIPPMYVVLAAAVLTTLAGLLPDTVKTWPVVAQAAFLGNYWQALVGPDGTPKGTGIFWAVAVEAHFYLIIPLIGPFLIKKCSPRGAASLLFALCLAILAWRCILVYGFSVGRFRTYICTDTRMDAIFYGCILGLYHNPMLDPIRLRGALAKWALLAVSALLLAATLLIRNPQFRETFRYSLQSILLFPVFYFAIVDAAGPLFRWLNQRWIRHLGLLSYSLFLVHYVVVNMIAHLWPTSPRPLMIALAAVASYLIALVLFYGVEQPSGKLRARLGL